MRMKKKFWIAILAAFLLLNLLPGMTPSAAADDTQSRETFYHECPNYKCRQVADLEIIGYVWKRAGYQLNDKQHWLHVLCPVCGEKGYLGGEDHIGGTETPTCTTGKTCEKCGGEYGKLWATTGAIGSPTATTIPTPVPASVKAATRLTRQTAAATAPRPVSRRAHAPIAASDTIADIILQNPLSIGTTRMLTGSPAAIAKKDEKPRMRIISFRVICT